MQSTSPRAIRSQFITTIKAIVPSFPEYRDARWQYVPKLAEVPGSLRNFHIKFSIASEVLTGIYCDTGVQKSFDCEIWTSYVGLGSDQDDSIISEDSQDIWNALSDLAESSGDGLLLVRPADDPWIDEEDEEGRLWGAHLFSVHFLAPNTRPL